jgi:hypothetical protein
VPKCASGAVPRARNERQTAAVRRPLARLRARGQARPGPHRLKRPPAPWLAAALELADPPSRTVVPQAERRGSRDGPSDFSQDAAGRADLRTTRRYNRARHNLDRHPTYARLPRITRTSGNGGVDSERTGQSSSGLDEGRSWYHLKHCNWVLGLTSTMPRRPTDGCRSAGAAVLSLMVRRGLTPRTSDNWNARCNGLMHSR